MSRNFPELNNRSQEFAQKDEILSTGTPLMKTFIPDIWQQSAASQTHTITTFEPDMELLSHFVTEPPLYLSYQGNGYFQQGYRINSLAYTNAPQLPQLDQFHTCDLSATTSKQPTAAEEFVKLVPLLSKINTRNYWGFLVHVIKDWHQHVSIDDFYNLLYRDSVQGFKIPQDSFSKGCHVDKSTRSKRYALELLYLIIETFKGTPTAAAHFPPGVFKELDLFSVSFHEFSRELLAIKITLSCIKETRDSSCFVASIPRSSFYKAYYILCQKLLQAYPAISSNVNNTILLCHSQLGKIAKMVYPNVVIKRLGRRGESKSHYMGLSWDSSIMDKHILKLLDLGMQRLEEYFSPGVNTTGPSPNRSCSPRLGPSNNIRSNSAKQVQLPEHPDVLQKPSISYVELSYRYPAWDCSPRIWGLGAGNLCHSEWSNEKIQGAFLILKNYQVALERAVQNFKSSPFSGHSLDILLTEFFNSIRILENAQAPSKAYMNLFLVILILIVPFIVASDNEITLGLKIQLRASLTKCITRCESESVNHRGKLDDASFKVFTSILRKMVSLSEITSSRTKAGHADNVIQAMAGDLVVVTASRKENLFERSALEEMFITSIVTSTNAYGCNLVDAWSPTAEEDSIEKISMLSHILKNIVVLWRNLIIMIPSYGRTEGENPIGVDVPYHVFTTFIQLFHEVTLADPLVQQLPICVINFIMTSLSSWIQNKTFTEFRKRDPELSKETFKCWWLFSTMVQEYLGIVSEVVALSESSSGVVPTCRSTGM
ncbi:hypothetical protein JCM33374_g1290 [Metschnikowia sp. JCM 33374]|nr:hypothetical protein JCM33374_g1290 [Metschnikowia sp. JCM 33374]